MPLATLETFGFDPEASLLVIEHKSSPDSEELKRLLINVKLDELLRYVSVSEFEATLSNLVEPWGRLVSIWHKGFPSEYKLTGNLDEINKQLFREITCNELSYWVIS